MRNNIRSRRDDRLISTPWSLILFLAVVVAAFFILAASSQGQPLPVDWLSGSSAERPDPYDGAILDVQPRDMPTLRRELLQSCSGLVGAALAECQDRTLDAHRKAIVRWGQRGEIWTLFCGRPWQCIGPSNRSACTGSDLSCPPGWTLTPATFFSGPAHHTDVEGGLREFCRYRIFCEENPGRCDMSRVPSALRIRLDMVKSHPRKCDADILEVNGADSYDWGPKGGNPFSRDLGIARSQMAGSGTPGQPPPPTVEAGRIPWSCGSKETSPGRYLLRCVYAPPDECTLSGTLLRRHPLQALDFGIPCGSGPVAECEVSVKSSVSLSPRVVCLENPQRMATEGNFMVPGSPLPALPGSTVPPVDPGPVEPPSEPPVADPEKCIPLTAEQVDLLIELARMATENRCLD